MNDIVRVSFYEMFCRETRELISYYYQFPFSTNPVASPTLMGVAKQIFHHRILSGHKNPLYIIIGKEGDHPENQCSNGKCPEKILPTKHIFFTQAPSTETLEKLRSHLTDERLTKRMHSEVREYLENLFPEVRYRHR